MAPTYFVGTQDRKISIGCRGSHFLSIRNKKAAAIARDGFCFGTGCDSEFFPILLRRGCSGVATTECLGKVADHLAGW